MNIEYTYLINGQSWMCTTYCHGIEMSYIHAKAMSS